MTAQPKFSKSAERRVKDRVAVPVTCPHCHAEVKFTSNAEVYGRAYGEWPWIYRCQADGCGAYVGTHPYTNLPLGTLATAAIRAARKRAKEQFNALWENGHMSRTEAYSWLAGQLVIPTAACHFGWFDEQQCARAIAVMSEARRPPVKTMTAATALRDLRTLLAARTPR